MVNTPLNWFIFITILIIYSSVFEIIRLFIKQKRLIKNIDDLEEVILKQQTDITELKKKNKSIESKVESLNTTIKSANTYISDIKASISNINKNNGKYIPKYRRATK